MSSSSPGHGELSELSESTVTVLRLRVWMGERRRRGSSAMVVEVVRLEGVVVFVIAAGSENSLVEWLLLRTAQLS